MRTFIFGAGASVHAGYPLAANLWRAIEPWVSATFPEGHDLRVAVDTMKAEFDLARPFELVLTDLDSRIEPFLRTRPTPREDMWEKVKLVTLRHAMRSMIPLYFNSVRSQAAELYRVFAADMLAPGDAIITFNYDLALDRELRRSGKWSIGDGYGFDIDSPAFGSSPCKLFKLHGSTNWRGELFQGSLGFGQVSPEEWSLGQRPIIDPSEFEYLEYTNVSDPRCHSGRVRIESIVMPTAQKGFYNETSYGREWEGFWNSLWLQAGEALVASNEIHLIGYSVPEFDTRAVELLATGISKIASVSVCCRSGTGGVVKSLKRLGIPQAQPAPAITFEALVSSAVPNRTQRYSPAHLSSPPREWTT